MKRILAVAVAALVLGGCGNSKIDQAHSAIKRMLNDPDSAQFRDDVVLENGRVCGEVNSKNKMGGYVGFLPYMFKEKQAPLIGQEDWQRETIREYCAKKS